MNTIHKNLCIAASFLLLMGAGCTQPAATSLNTDSANETALNTAVTNTNEAEGENTNAVLENTNGADSNTNDSDGETIDTSDWLTYTNEEYGFSFRYPDSLFQNYTSQKKFPMARVSIIDAPAERSEDNFEQTKPELLAAQQEIQDAVVDGHTYLLLPSGTKVKAVVSRAEGGSIIKTFYWYDEQYQYSFTFIFPYGDVALTDFLKEYNTADKVDSFIQQAQTGAVDLRYQDQFDLYNSVIQTLVKI